MSQAKIAQLPAAPAAPAGAPGAAAPGGVPGVTFVPAAALSPRDVAALRSRASELSNQLRSATNRRGEVQRSLRSATGADRAGLEQRLGVLDARIARLEGDIDENGSQLASLAANRTVSGQPVFPGDMNFPRNRAMNNLVPIVIVFTLFVLSPIAVSISRMFWRRGSMPRQAISSPENAQRLERMEQAIDSIAIEIERVSEGQRFVTRLMSDRQNALAGQNPAQPLSIPVGDKAGTPR